VVVSVETVKEDLVGLTDAAKRLGHAPNTLWRWSQREGFPEPVGTISGRKVWRFREIQRWAERRPGPGRPPAR
jgi:predicted DNA-binding transcriptional regulator AlpA